MARKKKEKVALESIPIDQPEASFESQVSGKGVSLYTEIFLAILSPYALTPDINQFICGRNSLDTGGIGKK